MNLKNIPKLLVRRIFRETLKYFFLIVDFFSCFAFSWNDFINFYNLFEDSKTKTSREREQKIALRGRDRKSIRLIKWLSIVEEDFN